MALAAACVAAPSIAGAQARPLGFDYWISPCATFSPTTPFGGVGLRAGGGLRLFNAVTVGAEFVGDLGGRSGTIWGRAGGGPIATLLIGSLAGWSYFEPTFSIGAHFTYEGSDSWVDPFARLSVMASVNSFRIGVFASVMPHIPVTGRNGVGFWYDVGLALQRYF